MSIELQMMKQEMENLKKSVYNFCSLASNALERISIYIDDDDPDEAKREVEELRESLRQIGSGS